MSVSAKVILLVGHAETLHDLTELGSSWGLQTHQRKDRLLHYQNPTSLSACGSIFFENFWREPMSVNAKVILLVEDDLTLYMMVTIVPTKR
jgi:hypothetical protein